MFWSARERIGALQPLKKHRNYLSFCMPALYGGFLVNSMKFIENQEIQWNMLKNHGNHEISWNSLIFWIPRPFTKPYEFLAQIHHLSGLDPQKPKNTIDFIIFLKFTQISPFAAEILENLQNDAKITFWSILVVPWPPHAENLYIPIGILRFLSSPGGLETLQNTENGEISPKLRKSANHENSESFMKFHEILRN